MSGTAGADTNTSSSTTKAEQSTSSTMLTPSQAIRRSNSTASATAFASASAPAPASVPASSSSSSSASATTTTSAASPSEAGDSTTAAGSSTPSKTLGPSWLKNKQKKDGTNAGGGYGAGGGENNNNDDDDDHNDGNGKNTKSKQRKNNNGRNNNRNNRNNRNKDHSGDGGGGGGGRRNNNKKNRNDNARSISPIVADSNNDANQQRNDNSNGGGRGRGGTPPSSTGGGRGKGRGRNGGQGGRGNTGGGGGGGRGSAGNGRDKSPKNQSDDDAEDIHYNDEVAKGRNRRKNRRGNKKSYPWRVQLKDVDQEEDPITLDRLDELEYPPFVLCRDAPFVPVPAWPVPQDSKPQHDESKKVAYENEKRQEELNRQRLAEQWGMELLPDDKISPSANKLPEPAEIPLSERKFWFFDGRALALYMVKQLQFVNPFDRRDLTRSELVNLDSYLKRHGLDSGLNVTEAYDVKGISLSSAGAAADTAEGRAQIMREMAEGLYNSLFSGGFDVRQLSQQQRQQSRQAAQSASSNPLQEQYAAMQLQEQQEAAERRRRLEQQQDAQAQSLGFGEAGIYGSAEEGGVMIIDDDQNPGLRGRGDAEAFPALSANESALQSAASGPRVGVPAGGPLIARFDGSRITGTSGSNAQSAFPALPSAAPRPTTTPSASNTKHAVTTINQNSGKKAPSKTSKTLNKIGGLIQRTDEQERQRQYLARQEARKKAMMSNLSFGMNPTLSDPSLSLLSAPAGNAPSAATEQQLQRNRAFADALGVTPATQRHYKSGWARPTDTEGTRDEFGQELGAALYPETLVAQAKERMQLLLKLEKKWKAFLLDDKAASLPLNHMDKPSRAFVHEYAEFWNLKTESFDPEPKRYVHCVKTIETRMPNPLLSTVTREWRGPLPDPSKLVRLSSTDHAAVQTIGQSSKSRDLVPLPTTLEAPSSTRVVGILGRERPKLELAPRTLPAALPPYEPQQQSDYSAAEDLRKREIQKEEQRKKEKMTKKKEQEALADAFASDDEDAAARVAKGGNAASSDDEDDWGEAQTPLFSGNDDE